MNILMVDYLYDFAINLTYEIHESGNIDCMKYVNNYCNDQGIDIHTYKKTLEDYCRYYLEENHGWFPDKEEVSDWYINYKRVRV